jgi:hypothetical protein
LPFLYHVLVSVANIEVAWELFPTASSIDAPAKSSFCIFVQLFLSREQSVGAYHTIILDINCCTTSITLVIQSVCASSEVALEPWRSCWLLASALVQAILRRTLYGNPAGSLENAVPCCALFTKPYHINDRAELLLVCVAMRMLLHSSEHLQISTVADRLSKFATCGRIPWEAPTRPCRPWTYKRGVVSGTSFKEIGVVVCHLNLIKCKADRSGRAV